METRDEKKKAGKEGLGEGLGGPVLPTHSAGDSPPPSITVPKHRLPHHSGLRLQLLNLLQERFLAGVLGPVSREKDKKHMTREPYTDVKTGCSLWDHIWMPFEAEAAASDIPAHSQSLCMARVPPP